MFLIVNALFIILASFQLCVEINVVNASIIESFPQNTFDSIYVISIFIFLAVS
jgi:hypothetical protein